MKIYIVAELSPISRNMYAYTDVYKNADQAQRHIMDRFNVPQTVSWGEFLAEDFSVREIAVDRNLPVDTQRPGGNEEDVIAFYDDTYVLSYAVRTV